MVAAPLAVFVGLFLVQTGQDAERIEKLIQNLGDSGKEERDKAVEELVRIGRPALEALRQATSSSDAEVKLLAAQAIEKIEWAGLDTLKKYVKDNFEEGASVEPSKTKGLARWFPDTRFYEVAGAPPAGGAAALMGMQAPRSLFAVRKFEARFQRITVKGIYSAESIRTLVRTGKIVLADEDAALDFALAYMDVYSAGVNANAAAMMMGGASRLEKSAEGWVLESSGYATLRVVFKTEKDGTLVDILQTSSSLLQYGLSGGADKPSEERNKLEVEKLKLEIDALKRQLEKK